MDTVYYEVGARSCLNDPYYHPSTPTLSQTSNLSVTHWKYEIFTHSNSFPVIFSYSVATDIITIGPTTKTNTRTIIMSRFLSVILIRYSYSTEKPKEIKFKPRIQYEQHQ